MSKLPMTVRKSVRDDFDTQKPDLESKISAALGVPWTVAIDAAAVYQYATSSYAQQNPGQLFTAYVQGFISNLESYIKKYGADGKSELNKLASQHVVTLEASDSTKFNYCGCDIADGALRILFRKHMLGTNIDDAASELHLAVNAAGAAAGGAGGMDFNAKQSVKLEFEPEIGALEAQARKIMNMPSLKLSGNFEANYAKLTAHDQAGGGSDLPRDWQKRIGQDALRYFAGFVHQTDYAKFAKDEMLQEGFQEAVDKGLVELRVVDKLQKKTYNEAIIDDGVLVIQTVPKYWNTNTDSAAEGIVDLL